MRREHILLEQAPFLRQRHLDCIAAGMRYEVLEQYALRPEAIERRFDNGGLTSACRHQRGGRVHRERGGVVVGMAAFVAVREHDADPALNETLRELPREVREVKGCLLIRHAEG